MKGFQGKTFFITITAALILAFTSSLVYGEDVIAVKGRSLTDQEMFDIRGGFTLPGGDYLYFSMDYLKLNLFSHQDSEAGIPSGYVSSLSQHALITKDGIQLDLNIFQGGGSSSSNTSGSSGVPVQLNSVLLNNSFTNFDGLANANIITGNYNVASIVNIINLKLGFFNKNDINSVAFKDFIAY